MTTYFKEFATLQQYNKYLINNSPNILICHILDIDEIRHYKIPIRTTPGMFGNIVIYAKNEKTLFEVTSEQYSLLQFNSNFIPQAICVISKNLLTNNKARYMALDNVFTDGQHCNNTKYLQWSIHSDNSELYEDTSLINFNNIKPYVNNLGVIKNQSGGSWGYIPIERSDWNVSCSNNSNLNYQYSNDNSIYHLYLEDWTLNTNLFNQNTEPSSLLMDQDGKSNTATLNTLHTGNNLYPAAHACYMYETEGIAQGEWYLPSITELMLMMTRFDTINSILNRLGALPLHTINYYWSSTEYSSSNAYYFITNGGFFNIISKNNLNLVRAFCMLSLASD